jgi:hypothetical protein
MVQSVFDLGGRVALWNIVYDGKRGANMLVACADDRVKGPRAVAVDLAGEEMWAIPTPGRAFCDCMHHGDLDLDGRPEIGFSVEEVTEFWVVNCDGKILWKKNIPNELGDDPHIDDFLIAPVLPEGRVEGNQLLLVTGPNLLDKDGNVLWSRESRFHHAQKVLAANLHPHRPGKEIYIVESYRRHAYLLTCDGETIWEYDNFTTARKGYEYEDPRLGRAIGRLTTAGDLIDWSGNGRTEIIQTEMGGVGGKRRQEIPPQAIRRFAHVLDRDGKAISIFPIEDSPMCACAARMTGSLGQDVVIVGHNTSRIYIYTKRSHQK